MSGGQQQRIVLARALAKHPDLLILDEATSALDTQSERLIQDTLKQLHHNRTIFVIAHRLSTVVNADQVVVLKDGRIVEKGRPKELLEKGGEFSELWNLQGVMMS